MRFKNAGSAGVEFSELDVKLATSYVDDRGRNSGPTDALSFTTLRNGEGSASVVLNTDQLLALRDALNTFLEKTTSPRKVTMVQGTF